jgi:S1-C subfamily serine protease
MANELAALSTELAAIVERTGPSVVAVHARPRFSSSGVFWRPGVIVTAEHTIRREEDITVTLPDGSTAAAALAGSDAGTDVAVLKVDSSAPVIPHASGDPSPGNLALALGRSENSGVNATMGIVSAVSGEWRTWRGGRLDRYIRLDLTLYPGSSGGPVVNTAGEALGIATSALSRIAGLAIPAATIDRVVDEILARGRVARGYLGVGLQPVELPDHHKGLIVLSLEPEGPAARAGVLIGDILVELGGAAVSDTEDIQGALESRTVGQPVEAVFLRGGVSRKITITVGERPRRS